MSDDHKLNKLLADVAGVGVLERTIVVVEGIPIPGIIGGSLPTKLAWVVPEEDCGSTRFHEWTPLTDHNQMALVKTALREQWYGYDIEWWLDEQHFECGIYKEDAWAAVGADELYTFAAAVAKMKGVGT